MIEMQFEDFSIFRDCRRSILKVKRGVTQVELTKDVKKMGSRI